MFNHVKPEAMILLGLNTVMSNMPRLIMRQYRCASSARHLPHTPTLIIHHREANFLFSVHYEWT